MLAEQFAQIRKDSITGFMTTGSSTNAYGATVFCYFEGRMSVVTKHWEEVQNDPRLVGIIEIFTLVFRMCFPLLLTLVCPDNNMSV